MRRELERLAEALNANSFRVGDTGMEGGWKCPGKVWGLSWRQETGWTIRGVLPSMTRPTVMDFKFL